jgi:hypothetical protein
MTERSMIDRMRGAAMLDIATYEEVEHDTQATGQAAAVVAIAAACSAIGGWAEGGTGMLGGVVSALLGWLVWSGITYLIGTKLFNGEATWGELLRTIGFAQAPRVFLILGIVPLLGGMIRLALFFWILATGIVAIRQALDVSTGKAVLTAVLGWAAVIAISIPFGLLAAVFG